MGLRFLSAFLGLLIVGGSGGLWLLYNIRKRKQLLQNLLSLPKGRRFFWYIVRKSGFRVTAMDAPRRLTLYRDGQPVTHMLKSDFLLKKDGRIYNGLFFSETDSREMIKILSTYMHVFRTDGAVFYNETDRSITVWEEER